MNELETLLNSLIKMGWKPWGKYNKVLDVSRDRNGLMRMLNSSSEGRYVNIRSIVSLESGLWQFVCSHLLIGPNKSDWMKNADIGSDGYITSNEYYTALNHEYRLLEAALIPEEELGQFLIDNIKTE